MRSMPSIASTACSSSENLRGCGRRRRAVGVDVLAEQRDLADALGGEPRDLVDQLLERPRDLAAARRRHDAERALHVAAGGDLHPAVDVARALARQVAGEALELEEALGGQRVGGQELGQLVHLARARTRRRRTGTARNTWSLTDCAQQPPTPITRSGSRALERARLVEVRDEALVGLLADRAGVEEDQVRVLARRAPRRSRATRACPSCARSRARSSGTRRW